MVNFYVAKASWGNDSVALVAWLTEHSPNARRVVIHNITGWHSEDWTDRIERCTLWASRLGWEVHSTDASLVQLAATPARSGFPSGSRPWCTRELKIQPTLMLLEHLDPEREATLCVGVRREESARRRSFPELVPADETAEKRDIWAPIVRMVSSERDDLLRRHGFEPLPHRSRECHPCMGAGKEDLRSLSEASIARVEAAEHEVGRTFFAPGKVGGAVGIREVVRWAHTDRGRYDEAQASFCDGGWCGL